jgi:hypothetical protein
MHLDAVRFYEKTDGVTKGPALSPVITNFFMEDFNDMTVDRAAHKPSAGYVDDSSSDHMDPTG